MLGTVILFVVVVAFAWNLGVHYTGAVMGMPYAARAIALWPALALIAVFTVLGATFASGGVQETVGRRIIADQLVTVPDAIVIVLAAGVLTTLYNYLRIPTSTIQILVFCVVGVGLGGGIPIHWATIGQLAVVWAIAPLAAFALGFVFTRLLDLLVPPAAARAEVTAQLAASVSPSPRRERGTGSEDSPLSRAVPAVALAWHLPPDVWQAAGKVGRPTRAALRLLPLLLVAVGIFASFVLGANDVANATGAFILTHTFPLMLAGLIGGLAMAVGTLTWGQRILHTVAFDVVKMDLSMASAAQGVQALVVLAAVTQGFFTSMNQALIGAMAGTGFARGRETVQRRQIVAILRGWLIGPLSGLALAFALETLVRLTLR
ncbi:MAG TPA: anion permease [Ktedonobacterales bacterium]|nr:anion permease [Ktedonobacterales bacterium]